MSLSTELTIVPEAATGRMDGVQSIAQMGAAYSYETFDFQANLRSNLQMQMSLAKRAAPGTDHRDIVGITCPRTLSRRAVLPVRKFVLSPTLISAGLSILACCEVDHISGASVFGIGFRVGQ